jgi:hypothetical protein
MVKDRGKSLFCKSHASFKFFFAFHKNCNQNMYVEDSFKNGMFTHGHKMLFKDDFKKKPKHSELLGQVMKSFT